MNSLFTWMSKLVHQQRFSMISKKYQTPIRNRFSSFYPMQKPDIFCLYSAASYHGHRIDILGVKRLQREAWHVSQSSTKIKDSRSYAVTLSTSSRRGETQEQFLSVSTAESRHIQSFLIHTNSLIFITFPWLSLLENVCNWSNCIKKHNITILPR
jgi:hypothetical protein